MTSKSHPVLEVEFPELLGPLGVELGDLDHEGGQLEGLGDERAADGAKVRLRLAGGREVAGAFLEREKMTPNLKTGWCQVENPTV